MYNGVITVYFVRLTAKYGQLTNLKKIKVTATATVGHFNRNIVGNIDR